MLFFQKFFIKMIRMNNGLIFGLSGILILLCSYLIYLLEPDIYENPFNGFWWVMTTVTTVGYGDYYPHTTAGKCLGIFLYIFGIGLISLVISKAIDTIFLFRRKKEEGKLKYKGERHFVVIDWNKHAQLAVEEILHSDPVAEVVLIGSLDRTPFVHDRIHYVQGNPVHRETLEQANLSKARAVFVFANDVTEQQHVVRDFSFIDGKTLLIASSIERFFGQVYTIVEIKDKENIQNFMHVRVDEFINGSDMISQLAVRSAFFPGASKIISQLLSAGNGEDLFEVPRNPEWITYRDAFTALLQEGATLISDGERLDINRRLEETISSEARLFVICDKITYQRLVG